MPEAIEVRKVPLHSVSDASELGKLIDDGVMEASRVIAIIGKTEGNGGVNDYTRIIADRAFREVLIEKGAPADQVKQVPIVWSGGTDGIISPHATIFATVPAEKAEPVGLMPALGIRQRQQDLALLTGAPGCQLAVDAGLSALADQVSGPPASVAGGGCGRRAQRSLRRLRCGWGSVHGNQVADAGPVECPD